MGDITKFPGEFNPPSDSATLDTSPELPAKDAGELISLENHVTKRLKMLKDRYKDFEILHETGLEQWNRYVSNRTHPKAIGFTEKEMTTIIEEWTEYLTELKNALGAMENSIRFLETKLQGIINNTQHNTKPDEHTS